jgi:hypothetical protein
VLSANALLDCTGTRSVVDQVEIGEQTIRGQVNQQLARRLHAASVESKDAVHLTAMTLDFPARNSLLVQKNKRFYIGEFANGLCTYVALEARCGKVRIGQSATATRNA